MIPLPSELVPAVAEHLRLPVVGRADARMFPTLIGRALNMSKFQRDVWAPAREAVFAPDGPLRGAQA